MFTKLLIITRKSLTRILLNVGGDLRPTTVINVGIVAASLIVFTIMETFFPSLSFFTGLGMLGFYCGCADDVDGSGPGAGGSSSDTGSGDVGSDGAMDSGPGCGYCDGGDGGGYTSTPYLYLKKKDGHFIMQNDVMVGTPSTYATCKHVGMERHETGMLGKDLYPVSLEGVDVSEGLDLEIREIEPEESFIYDIRAHFFNIPHGSILLQDWSHETLRAFKKDDIKSLGTPVFLNQKTNIQSRFGVSKYTTHQEEKQNAVRLEKGDQLTFEIKEEKDLAQTHLIVSSFWRNWIAGMLTDDIHGVDQRLSDSPVFGQISLQTRKLVTRTASVFALISGMLFGGPHFQVDHRRHDNHDLLAFIKKVNFAQLAHADTPHGAYSGDAASLRISYKHPMLGTYVHFATVQPRVYMPTDIVVTIPEAAFNGKTHKAEVMIEATKAHYVKNISLVHCDSADIVSEQTVSFKTNKLNGVDIGPITSTDPLHMAAGDVLSLRTEKLPQIYTNFALEIYGFYTPLSQVVKNQIGDWQSTLGPKERALMNSIYN